MRKVNKSPKAPSGFANYVKSNPNAKWKTFRRRRKKYRELKSAIFNDQQWICGYCERAVNPHNLDEQVIEHFHDRSDNSTSHNWDLDWNNMLGVCTGGKEINTKLFPRSVNLSCDAHKNVAKQQGSISDAPEGVILNPLHLPSYPCLFDFEPWTGNLKPHADKCKSVNIPDNKFGSVAELVQNTIDILNLNCSRLAEDRKQVFQSYQSLVAKARQQGDVNIKENLANQWFGGVVTSFYTTRRILLGELAEQRLRR